MEKRKDKTIELPLTTISKSEVLTSSNDTSGYNRFNKDLDKECTAGNFDAVWMLIFAGATNIKNGIHISIQHGHYKVTALLLICHAIITEDISMLEALLKGDADFQDLVAFLPNEFIVFDEIRKCLENKEEFTKVGIQVASRSKKARPTDVLKCLLLNTRCEKKERKVDWGHLSLESLHESWIGSIDAWVQDLNLSSNNLYSLPNNLVNLKSVTRLNLSVNNLDVITREIFSLPCLRNLNLSRNNLCALPEFSELKPVLKSLNVSDNKLKELPQSITRSGIEILNLSKNCFTEVPLCVCEMTTLKDLDLSDNREISHLPDMMGKLRNLHHLGLKHLDKITEPPEELRKNAQDVVSTLRKKLRCCQRYYTMKLMLVGKAGEGKTTLAHRLQDDFSYNNDDDHTEGIDISDLVIKKSALNKKFTFKVWDFNGQEDYYATHQCFLSTMSLYLLVWRLIDGEEGVEGLTPWLDNIAVRSPGSTVIVVGTHLDCISPEKYGHQYVDNLKNLVHQLARKPRYRGKIIVPPQGICAVSCASGNNKIRSEINKLRQVIYDTAANLKKGRVHVMGELIPASFFSLIDRIEKRKTEMQSKNQPPIIRKDEFEAMVKNYQQCKKDIYIQDPNDVRDATVFLRERGIVMHFDDPNEGLSDLYFIDPRWLCAQMTRVVAVKSDADLINDGIVEVQKTSPVFQRDDLPLEFVSQLIRLLVRFQVAYPLDETRILVPTKLPEKKPEEVEKLKLSFVPVRRIYMIDHQTIHGFWTRFMSRLFFYMKEMIAVHPTRRCEKSCGSEHEFTAKFCRSCAPSVEASSGMFPCFLENVELKKAKSVKKKKTTADVTQTLSADSARRSASMHVHSAPPEDDNPSVKLFSEEELVKSMDDDVVGIIINNVEMGAKSNIGSGVESPGRFQNGYLVFRRLESVNKAAAAMGLRTPSYDGETPISKVVVSESENSGGCKAENEDDVFCTDCLEDQLDRPQEKLGTSNQECEVGSDCLSPSYDGENFTDDKGHTMSYEKNPMKDESHGDNHMTSIHGKENVASDEGQSINYEKIPAKDENNKEDPAMPNHEEKGLANDGGQTMNYNPMKNDNDEEDGPANSKHEATSSDESSRHSPPSKGFIENITPQKPKNSTSVQDKEWFTDENNAELDNDSRETGSDSGTSFQESLIKLEKSASDSIKIIGISENPVFEFPEVVGSLKGDIHTTVENSCKISEDHGNGNVGDVRRLEDKSTPNTDNQCCLMLDHIDLSISSDPETVDFVSHSANSNKDRLSIAQKADLQHIFSAENPETSSFSKTPTTDYDNPMNNQSYPEGSSVSMSTAKRSDIVPSEESNVVSERTSQARKTSGNPSDINEADKCTMCGETGPADQLVSIPLDVAKLMEKNYLQCWRSGICLNHPNVFLAVSRRSLSDTVVIDIAVTPSPLGRRLLTSVVDHLDTLIKEWYPGLLISFGAEPTIEKLIPCRLCEENGVPKPHVFTFDSCVTQYGAGDFVKCPQHEAVGIQDIAPDVVLQDLASRLLLDDEEIQYDTTDADKLGDGAYGAVYRGFCRGNPAAIKEFSNSSGGEEDAMKQYREVRKEINVMKHIGQHPFLVNLIGVCLRPFRLVLELADKGSLDKTLTNSDFLIDRIVIYRMIYQVADALSFLHSLNVIYRDLKPGNVLVMSYEEQDDVNIKLTDFGTATFQFSEGLRSVQGSPGHHAPEMLARTSERSGYNDKVDVFSLGMLVYSFITRRRPFSNVNSVAEINYIISQGEKPKYDDVMLSRVGLVTLTWLMEKCLEFNPNLRPSSKSIARQASSPCFQLLLGRTIVPRGQSVHHVCIVEVTRELWVAAGNKTRSVVLVYDTKTMTIKKEFATPLMCPSNTRSYSQIKCMHVTTESVVIGLRGDRDVVVIYDMRTYELKAKIILMEPLFCVNSNDSHIFLGMSSGLLCVIPTSGDKRPETVEVNDDLISSMISVDKYLWLTSKNFIYIFNTEPGKYTCAFELDAIRCSLDTPSVTIATTSQDRKSIWCVCKPSSIVTCWDVEGRKEICRINCESAVRRVLTNELPSPVKRCVTCLVVTLDTVWVGTGGGLLLIFEPQSGELITWMHLFDDHVRTLTLVSEPGPYSRDRGYVIASGAHLREAALSCDGDTVCSLVQDISEKPKKMTKPVKRSRTFRRKRARPQVEEDAEFHAGGFLLLFEVLPAEVLRRIEAKSPR